MDKNEKKLVGVKEIARRANVSIATVDRVLHDRKGVSETTKQKILEIIKELDYKPNQLASRLASAKPLKFFTLIPMVSEETEYWQVPLDGIVQAANEIKPYNVDVIQLFYDMNDKSSFITQSQKIVEESHVDGILLAPAFINETIEFTEICRRRNIPFVFINSDIPNQKSLCYFGPDLFYSGFTAAHLVNYLIQDKEDVLLLNISKDIESDHHILRKEEGFVNYFKTKRKKNILKKNIHETDYNSVSKVLTSVFEKESQIKVVFVTNSRVSLVARFLKETGRKDVCLIGYDFLEKNIKCLNEETIDFLICEKPQEQAYRGVKALYRFSMFNERLDKDYFMPIDIIHKENQRFYRN